jgi:hypothetical protein
MKIIDFLSGTPPIKNFLKAKWKKADVARP